MDDRWRKIEKIKKATRSLSAKRNNYGFDPVPKKCTQERKKYANMKLTKKIKKCASKGENMQICNQNKKKARIRQQKSIVMKNLACVAAEEEVHTSIQQGLYD